MAAATDNVRVAVRTMKQDAVYWAPLSELTEFGKPDWEAGIEIKCRWEDVVKEIIAPNGETVLSNSTLIVDRDLKVKGVLMLGDLDSTVDDDDPKENDGAFEIIQIGKTPDFKGRKFLREAYL